MSCGLTFAVAFTFDEVPEKSRVSSQALNLPTFIIANSISQRQHSTNPIAQSTQQCQTI